MKYGISNLLMLFYINCIYKYDAFYKICLYKNFGKTYISLIFDFCFQFILSVV